MTTTKNHDEGNEGEGKEPDDGKVLGPQTPMRLATVVAILGAVVTFVYFFATMNAKLDMLVSMVNSASTRADGTSKALEEHKSTDMVEWTSAKARLLVLETVGSPKALELERRLNALETEMKIHEKAAKP